MKSIVGAFSAIPTCFISAALLLSPCGIGRAEIASVYGESDGLCGHRTANGERLNCAGTYGRASYLAVRHARCGLS
jgi:hypothetical protein